MENRIEDAKLTYKSPLQNRLPQVIISKLSPSLVFNFLSIFESEQPF